MAHAGKRSVRAAKIALAALGGFVVLAVLAVLLLSVWANTASGRERLAALAAEGAAAAGLELDLESVSGRLPFSLRARRVAVSDAEGVWLEVDGLRFAWSPWSLLLGRVHVREMGANDVVLYRPPTLAPGEPGPTDAQPRDWANVLKRVRIDGLDFTRIELGEAVIGQRVVFTVNGRFGVHERGTRMSRLAVSGLEGHRTTLVATSAWDVDDQHLALSLEGRAPAGGALATVVGVAEGSGIDVAVSGEGALDEWRGTLRADAGDANADLLLETGREGGHRVMALAGRLDPAELLARHIPPEWVGLAGGGVDLSVRVDEMPGKRLRVSDLDVRSATAELTGGAVLDRRGQRIEGTVRLRQPDGARLTAGSAGLDDLEALDLRINAVGPWASPRLAAEGSFGALRAAGFSIGAGTVSGFFEPPGSGGLTGGLGLHLSAEQLAWALAGSDRLVRGPAKLSAAGSMSEGPRLLLDSLDVVLPDATATGSLDLDLKRRRLHAPLELEVSDLSVLDGLARVDLEGRGTFDVDVRLPTLGGRIEIGIVGRLTESVLNLPVAGALVGPRTLLEAQVVVDPVSGLTVAPLRISGDRADVSGTVRMPAGYARLQVDAVAEMAEGRPLGDALGLALSGPVRAEASLDGPPADPGVVATVIAGGLTAGGVPLDDVALSCELANLASGLNGPVRLSAVAPGGPLEASTRLRMTGDRLELGDIDARNAATHLSGALAVNFSGAPLSGNLRVRLADIQPWLAVSGLEGSGAGTVTLDLRSTGEAQFLAARLNATNLRVARPGGASVFAGEITGDVDVADLLSAPALDARLEADNLRGPATDLTRLSLMARGPLDDLALTIRAGGMVLEAPTELALDAGITRSAVETRIAVGRLDGEFAGQAITLDGTPDLTITGSGVRLTDAVISVGAGELRAALLTGGPGAFVDLAAEDLPMSLLSLVGPGLKLEGTAGGALRLDDAGAGARGRVSLQVQDMRFSKRRSAPPISAALSGELDAGRLAFDARAEAGTARPVQARGEIPLDIDLVSGSAGLRREGPLSVRVDWQGEASHLLNLMPASDHVLSGPVDLKFAVDGTVARPRMEGRVEVSQGRYEHLLLGTLLEPLDILLVADGRELRVERFEARDGGSGRVAGGGRVGLDPDAGWPAELSVSIENARLLRRDDVTAQATGEIRIRGGGENRMIEGRLVTDEVRANLVNRLPPEVVVLDVIDARSLEPDGDRRQESGRRADTGIGLDITVEIPRRMYVRGLGLDSEWEGRFAVGGTTGNPRITGRLESVRGIMQFLGRRFRFEPSTITFAGGRKIDPELDITAVHESSDLDVTARVSGPVSDVEIGLTSVPSVPEDEILSRTLFGKSTGELSALEAVQLAGAVAELTGSSGGAASALSRLRDTAGIDVLRFGSTETDEGEQATTLEAGKYVAEGLYVGVETSTAEESGAVSVEFDITRRLRLKTDLEQTGGQNIGIEYKRDY
jgi:translocation and assembly module TamB